MRRAEGTFYHNICGTYVHGIFDKEEVALGAVIKAVGDKQGISTSSEIGRRGFCRIQRDSSTISWQQNCGEHLDMKKIYEILNAGNQGRESLMKVELENVKPM